MSSRCVICKMGGRQDCVEALTPEQSPGAGEGHNLMTFSNHRLIKTTISPHPQEATLERRKQQALVRMWRNWDLCMLPLGLQDGAATVGNIWVDPQNYKLPCYPEVMLRGGYPKRMESRKLNRNLHTNVHSCIIHES